MYSEFVVSGTTLWISPVYGMHFEFFVSVITLMDFLCIFENNPFFGNMFYSC